jgi:glycosyltransferase involved in cell wall biosynthesis
MSPSATQPNILFMGRIFEVPWGGVRELADELLRAAAPICAEQGRTIEVLVPRPGLCPVRSPAIREVVLSRFAGNRILWDHWTVRGYANRQPNAVLYNVKLVLPEGLRIPGFTTLHDLMYFPQPAKYHWREYLLADSLYMRLFVRRTVRRAPLTAVVSNYTRQDAIDLFPEVDPGRFRVMHSGIDPARWANCGELPGDQAEWARLEGSGLRRPFVFYSGGLSRRKNVRVLAAAFERFSRRHPEYQLVVTGGAKPTMGDPALRRALNRIAPGSVIRLGTVSARALVLLYQRAEFFVFPSLYEGFGFPPLEAQAAGCPVICSTATSLPEVVGESALTFDPRSPGALVALMERLTSREERERLIAAGLENVRRFRWEAAARRWLALADEAAAAARR